MRCRTEGKSCLLFLKERSGWRETKKCTRMRIERSISLDMPRISLLLIAAIDTFARLMDGPDTVTWEEFVENAESFVLVSNEISDGWDLLGDKTRTGEAYLSRTAKRFISSDFTSQNSCMEEDTDWCKSTKEGIDPFEASSNIEMPLTTEHHILWSMSYSVPVLYFNGWKSDFPGINPVSVEEVQKLAPDGRLNYTELSQAIHPILGRPFLQLHPCMSHELLRNTRKSKNKLVSWLSSVSPAALNLDLSPEYYKLTF